jgi:hypothetical protein
MVETTEQWKEAMMIRRVGDHLEAIPTRVARVPLLNVAHAAAKLADQHIVWIKPEDLAALAAQCGLEMRGTNHEEAVAGTH